MKALLFFLLFPLVLFSQQRNCDILIRNGKIIDGTGNNWFYGDVAVKDGKIIGVGRQLNFAAQKTIDATGLIIAPGFIDVHTHLEGDEAKDPNATNFILDGVTTCITGNCGSSNIDIGKYLQFIDSLKLSINVATLIGHNDVRKAVMGRANRDATPQEMQQYNGVYASHMRDEGDSIVYAINEALTVGREAKIPVEISHFKLSGQQNWGRSKETVPMIEAARKQGIEVTIDQYPYTASSTSISTLIPDEILADNQDSINSRLQNPDTRKYVINSMLKRLKKRKLKHFSYAVVAYYKPDTSYNGKSIEQINLMRGNKHTKQKEAETIVDIMMHGGASAVFHGMSEEDVKRIMKYPFNMFASDASIRVLGAGVPHPRGYGTNARVLAEYVRDQKVISLEEAIRRMTSLPAQKFQLHDRGLIAEGYAADIVIFDESKVQDVSTYDHPHAYSQGFKYVIVNGMLTVENEKHLGLRAGQALYGPGTVK